MPNAAINMNNRTILQRRALVWLYYSNLFVIVLLWWVGSASFLSTGVNSSFIALGRVTGLLAEYFILIELVLISRTPFIEQALGFDSLNHYHRVIGYALTASIVSHPLFLTIGYAGGTVPLFTQFMVFVTRWDDVLKATIGFVLILGIAFVSLPAVRKKLHYESWHALHLLMYGAIALAFTHQIKTADVSHGLALYYWIFLNMVVFGSVLLFRFLQPLFLFWKHQMFVERIVKENDSVYSIYISGQSMHRFRFKAGQYVHLMILKRGLWHPHPFSLSSAYNGRNIRVTIKALGDFTNRIGEIPVGTKVLIEGPFGRFIQESANREKFLFIAGGIGITPIRAILESDTMRSRNSILIYSVRSASDSVFTTDLASFATKVYYLHTQRTAPGYGSGHIDRAYLEQTVPDLQEREIYLCGPAGMTASLIQILNEAGVPQEQIHFERFSY